MPAAHRYVLIELNDYFTFPVCRREEGRRDGQEITTTSTAVEQISTCSPHCGMSARTRRTRAFFKNYGGILSELRAKLELRVVSRWRHGSSESN